VATGQGWGRYFVLFATIRLIALPRKSRNAKKGAFNREAIAVKNLASLAAIGFMLAGASAWAQPAPGPRDAATKSKTRKEREAGPPAAPPSLSQMTPEMWLLVEDMRRHDDPHEAVRRKAEFRAAQRMRRIAAREWFGYSNMRPVANPVPWFNNYSPRWTSNNAMRPEQWSGNNRGAVYSAGRPLLGGR
jgi:hypothetical protein